MQILLTGSTGQVGRALVSALAPLGSVLATDRSSFDMTKPEQIRRRVLALRPDVIVNAAAYSDVEAAETDEQTATMVNGAGVGELASVARELDAMLIHYSTDYVFDGAKPAPYLEDDEPAPLSAYGRSKLEGERQIQASGCAHLILRTSWVYSVAGRNFLNTMLRLAAEREELRVVDDQVGAPTFAGFVATSTAQMLQQIASRSAARSSANAGDTVHLVNGGATSWFGFASSIFASATVQRRVRSPRLIAIKTADFPARARRPMNSRLDTGKATSIWNLKIPHWRDSLQQCLNQLP